MRKHFVVAARATGAALALAASAAAATPAAAQQVSLAPTIGVFIPTTDLLRATTGDADLTKQEVSITFGGRLGIWFGERIGIVATGAYAPSDLKFTSEGQVDPNVDANVLTGSGRVLVFLIPPSSPVWLQLSGGVGVVSRSGEFYENAEEKTDVGGAVGAGVGFRIGEVLRLQINADTYLYNTKVQVEGFEPTDDSQKDVHLSFGVAVPVLGFGR